MPHLVAATLKKVTYKFMSDKQNLVKNQGVVIYNCFAFNILSVYYAY